MSWIAKEVKAKILHSIENEWVPVMKLSEEYGISKVTIYGWLKEKWDKVWSYNLQELKRLKKDKEDLLIIIWELIAELNKTKKKN